MNFFSKLFGKSKLIEVPASRGIGDGSPLLVERNPNLESIFTSSDPPSPRQPTEQNRNRWKNSSLRDRRYELAMAYLAHPDPSVRASTVEFAKDLDAIGIDQMFVDLLADPSINVRRAAAKCIWERQRGSNCEFAVHALRDEIRGHIHGFFGTSKAGLTLGRDLAIQALDLLVEEAPDEDARKAIRELVDRDVVIEERVKPVEISSVEYVEKTYRDAGGGKRHTYEVYRAKNKQQALAFLKTKEVRKKLYYVEVETPEGTFGRDIDGMYEV